MVCFCFLQQVSRLVDESRGSGGVRRSQLGQFGAEPYGLFRFSFRLALAFQTHDAAFSRCVPPSFFLRFVFLLSNSKRKARPTNLERLANLWIGQFFLFMDLTRRTDTAYACMCHSFRMARLKKQIRLAGQMQTHNNFCYQYLYLYHPLSHYRSLFFSHSNLAPCAETKEAYSSRDLNLVELQLNLSFLSLLQSPCTHL